MPGLVDEKFDEVVSVSDIIFTGDVISKINKSGILQMNDSIHTANPLESGIEFTFNWIVLMKTKSIVELDLHDLPAYCPNPAMPLWSSHPKVFLDMTHNGHATCPYCSTEYQLKAGVKLKAH